MMLDYLIADNNVDMSEEDIRLLKELIHPPHHFHGVPDDGSYVLL